MAGKIDSYNITLAAGVPMSIEETGVEHRALDISITPESGLTDVMVGSPERQLSPVGQGIEISDISINGVDQVWDMSEIFVASATGGTVNILVTLID